MYKNYLSIILLSFFCAFSINVLVAQEKKEEYKVVVIEKTIDEEGNVIEHKEVKTGEDAKAYIESQKLKKDSGVYQWISKDGEIENLEGKKYKMLKKVTSKLSQKMTTVNKKSTNGMVKEKYLRK